MGRLGRTVFDPTELVNVLGLANATPTYNPPNDQNDGALTPNRRDISKSQHHFRPNYYTRPTLLVFLQAFFIKIINLPELALLD